MSSNINQPTLINQKTGDVILLKQSITIGRKGSNSIIITNDAKISREHAKIFWQYDSFVIEDLGSANGSYVNKERLTEIRILENNDIVQLGRTQFKIQIPSGFSEKETFVGLSADEDFNESPTIFVGDEDNLPTHPVQSSLPVSLPQETNDIHDIQPTSTSSVSSWMIVGGILIILILAVLIFLTITFYLGIGIN